MSGRCSPPPRTCSAACCRTHAVGWRGRQDSRSGARRRGCRPCDARSSHASVTSSAIGARHAGVRRSVRVGSPLGSGSSRVRARSGGGSGGGGGGGRRRGHRGREWKTRAQLRTSEACYSACQAESHGRYASTLNRVLAASPEGAGAAAARLPLSPLSALCSLGVSGGRRRDGSGASVALTATVEQSLHGGSVGAAGGVSVVAMGGGAHGAHGRTAAGSRSGAVGRNARLHSGDVLTLCGPLHRIAGVTDVRAQADAPRPSGPPECEQDQARGSVCSRRLSVSLATCSASASG